MTSSPDTVSRLRKLPSRIAANAVSNLFSAAVSTEVVPVRDLLRDDCPPCARVLVLRVAAPDSTVSLRGFDLLPDISCWRPAVS
ncbi:hypothetical protein GBW32_27145 [Streptomyces tsukubensis]|uniref:Uncharacterized protein n=1 Tax=Streptomyces tsukubensis TaxID=83656 RepID=A0A1V3ZZ18_9ACTN|nr:hypothetical protein B1H18_32745 [Streptomyces tsukubensis]QFR98047.1 hypothetical protein GBW32_27145 [Streptomyces tsukubensis]